MMGKVTHKVAVERDGLASRQLEFRHAVDAGVEWVVAGWPGDGTKHTYNVAYGNYGRWQQAAFP